MREPVESAAVRQSLLRLLEAHPPEEERLLEGFRAQRAAGYPLFSTVLYILTHLNFAEPEAERHWEHIRAHRAELKAALGRDVGLRVALLDYFVNLNHELKNPKVIEIAIYETTARSAVTDGLTGLFNHAYFLAALRRETQRAKRHGAKVSLAMLDLDDFKRLNDTRGHVEGDKVLVKSAELVGESLREIDIAARYGGEEFAVILPDTGRTGGFVVAERIRARLDAHFRRRRSAGTVTLSGGVATFPDDAPDHEQLVRRADEALYRAKAAGKNRIIMMGGERRRAPRIPIGRSVTVKPAHARGALVARAENLSDGGLCLRTRKPIPIGSTLAVRLRGERRDALSGEVVRVQKARDEGALAYELGLRILEEFVPRGSWLFRRVPAPV
jgi:diguanylate cyclase (GGDEF)-like protein